MVMPRVASMKITDTCRRDCIIPPTLFYRDREWMALSSRSTAPACAHGSVTDESVESVVSISIGQFEHNMNQRGGIVGLPIALRRMKTDLLGRPESSFVQTMPQSSDHSFHSQFPRSGKCHADQHLAFQMQLARFLSVYRGRFVNDLYRQKLRLILNPPFLDRRQGLHLGKPGLLHCAFPLL